MGNVQNMNQVSLSLQARLLLILFPDTFDDTRGCGTKLLGVVHCSKANHGKKLYNVHKMAHTFWFMVNLAH